MAEVGQFEVDQVTLGFLEVTDMAPLTVAVEAGFFQDEGLIVTPEAQDSWSSLIEGVAEGRLQGGQMLGGHPLGAAIGYGAAAEIVVPYVFDLNGNAITVSSDVCDMMNWSAPKQEDGRPQHPISAGTLFTVLESFAEDGRQLRMGMVSPVSPQNYELRYWLAAGGVHPCFYAPGNADGHLMAQAFLSVTPPAKMPETLNKGEIDGFSVGQPWNSVSLAEGSGVPVIPDHGIFRNNPEKVLGFSADFAAQSPNTTTTIARALIRASMWLDARDNANRETAVELLSRAEYVGAAPDVIGPALMGTFEYELDDIRDTPDFNIFFRGHASYPFSSDAIWILTQLRRWGQIPEGHDDSWYHDIAAGVYRPDLYMEAAQSLVADGLAQESAFPYTDGYRPPSPPEHFIDGIPFDARRPNGYLEQFPIGLKGEQHISDGEVQG